MKKSIVKILAAVLAFVMMFSFTPSLTAEAAKLEKKTIYLSSASSTTEFSIYADKATKVSNVKSSNKKAVTPDRYNISKYTNVNLKDNRKSVSNGANVYFKAVKPGNATVSFKAGKTGYSQKVTVKKYVNPLKSLTVSNINGGKDIHKLFSKSAYAPSGKLKMKAAKQVKINAKAIKGWEVTYIGLSSSASGAKGYSSSSAYRSFNTGASSASATLCDYSAKGYNYGSVTFRNKKDNGTITISFSLFN